MAMDPDALRMKARSFWADFSASQKMIVAALIVSLVAGGYIFTKWVAKPSMAPLFSNLSADDASSITGKLNTQSIPYELADGGKTIMVPQNAVYQTRVDMSAQGLPSGGGGYALLDKQGITASEFKQRIDYQRALEGEISKTISSIDGVQGSTVHLVIPAADVFADDSRKPSASVMVMTADSKKLNSNQVKAIVNLTSGSVEGLSPDMVTVADNKGNVLAAPGDASASGDEQSSKTSEFETSLAAQVQGYLAGALGDGHAFVTVSADLDFDKKQITTESYDNTATAPTLSEDTSTETFSGNGSSAVGGILGPNASVATPGADGTSSYGKNSAKRDYGVNKIIESVAAAPGQVKRLSVAVMIDSKVESADLATIKNQVAAAAGIDPNRGDTIAVDTMAFDDSNAKAAEKDLKAQASAKSMKSMIHLAETVLMVLAIVVLLFLTKRAAKKRQKQLAEGQSIDIRQLESVRRPALAGAGGYAGGGGGGNRGALVLDNGDTYSLDEIPDASPLGVTAEGAERINLESQITDLIDKQPDEVASLLRTWLADRRD